jgi:O-antigen ligase
MAVSSVRTGIAGVFVVSISYLLAAASGLMIAPFIAIWSIISFPVRRSDWQFERFPVEIIPVGLFLAWVGLSFLWSPYDNPEQIPKTLLGIPLYALFALRVGRLEGDWRRWVEAAFIFTTLAVGLGLLSESLIDGRGTRNFKIAFEGLAALDPQSAEINVNRSLGHATAPLLLMAGPVALMAWRYGAPILGGIMIALTAWAAFSFKTEINAAALLLAIPASAVAWRWPRASILILFSGIAAAFIIMPLILPELIDALPQDFKDGLPLSWNWRLEIWSHVGGLVREAPIFGHGLDAARPLNHQMVLQGYDIELIPLHPHNATLHVWLETGLVGAVLLAVSLVMLGRRISGAVHLSRLQAVAIAWTVVAYVTLIVFSYGVWQEWHQGAVALAATAIFFLGAGKPAQ